MLGLHDGSVVSADALVELLWGDDPPRTATKALQTHISALRRALGDGFVVTAGAGWTLAESEVDATRYTSAARQGRDNVAAGDTSRAVARFDDALVLWRGVPELPDGRRGTSEKTRWIEGHAALVEDRLDALLATGRAAEVVGDLEAAVAEAPLRERRWGQLMLALYRAGRQGEALSTYQRARSLLARELGVDPGPELRRLESAIVAQDTSLNTPAERNLSATTRAVTFLLTDIEGSTAAWEADAKAMGVALARHDELVEQVVTSRGGRLIKTRGEGDATFSVFDRPSAAAAAAIEMQDAIAHEPWTLREPMRIRVALHTGEVELRDGDYFGRAVNRAARLRSLADGGQILCSGATAELVIDSLSDDVALNDLGMRHLKNLARPEHVFELRLETGDKPRADAAPDEPVQRPALPAVLAGPGPFVGRGRELGQLLSAWQTTLAGGANAVLIAGEPGVGKTRLSGEWSRQAYDQGALVIYGRCDEDLGAPYQPFAEALRSLVPCLGAKALRGLRGVEALLALVPGLPDVVPDIAAPTRADPDTERFALFDAVVALLGLASASAPVVLVLDDLHWAAKPTLLLLRHLLRFGEQARVQIVGTYRSTDLDRSHPLAAMLADLHRDGSASRVQLTGLDEDDVTAYVAEAGYDDEELARALASVTAGNPFFLIEALRHVEESGGHWDPSTLPQGVREAVSRRLSRLAPETNKALGAAAVVGSRFALDLVERVVEDDLVDAFDEACKAGIVIEEPGGNYRFNHALVRQSLLAELTSVRRMRLHQRIATTLETRPGADDELLAELAHHYFECAWAGNAAKAVDYCRRAADQAMARLGYEAAADLYDRALHALEEIDEQVADRDDQVAELLIARCEALLAAGDVTTAAGAVSQLQRATTGSARLAAWATCFDGELSMLIHPERLDEIDAALDAAASKLAELNDAAGEAKAQTVRASCLARLGRIGDCEVALDDALTAARRAGEHRRVNAVLAGAPLAALWGPNPVPRAGGRCLDVVRLLRITTESPAVEATSTRCQAVLEAFRGRAEAARRMIASARRTVTELGLRHALLEVEQFAGIVELVTDDPAAAESRLRQAYNGFRRMGLDADTAETAALLGRACLALDRGSEADELCTESERLAGHALKPAIAWRVLRAELLSRTGDHDEARRQAEAAVALAERTDALVDHGDACLALATVLGIAGDLSGSRAAAERAADLYERKGAAALAEKARRILGGRAASPVLQGTPSDLPTNACVQMSSQVIDAVNREAWTEVTQLVAPRVSVESRRRIVGFNRIDVPSSQWPEDMKRYLETGMVRYRQTALAVRGERLALSRLTMGTADESSGAPQDEELQVVGIDDEGRIASQVKFDPEDFDAAVAELDALQARFDEEAHRRGRKLANAASQSSRSFLAHFAAGDRAATAEKLADNFSLDDRRRVVGSGLIDGRDAAMASIHAIADVFTTNPTPTDIATRGKKLLLGRLSLSGRNKAPEAFISEMLTVNAINDDHQLVAIVGFDLDDLDAAITELDRRYLADEAAAYVHTWSAVMSAYAAINRRELPSRTADFEDIDHRRTAAFAPGDMVEYLRAGWDLDQNIHFYIEVVHDLSNCGALVTHKGRWTSREGFEAEWREIMLFTTEGDSFNRCEVFDEADLDTAIARFDQLSRTAPQLENAASQAYERIKVCYADRNWRAMADMVSDNFLSDDRRKVVNSGVRRGREAITAELSGMAETGIDWTSDLIATRGAHLVANRIRAWGHSQGPDGFDISAFDVIEIDAHDRLATRVVFDIDDIDSAIAELDARYVAGEAAAHARTWSVVTGAYDGFNQRELAATTPERVNIDHRRGADFAPGDMIQYLQTAWSDSPDTKIHIAAVHRLSKIGAVVTHMARGTSQEGFDAEWRDVHVLIVDGDKWSRSELFDEADIDAAIARFDELSKGRPRLENAASRAADEFLVHMASRDWLRLATALSPEFSSDDRRRVVGAGVRRGPDAGVADLESMVDVGINRVKTTPVAIRGERILLARGRLSAVAEKAEDYVAESLAIVAVDAKKRIVALINFDLEDLDTAIAELDRRYGEEEAASYSSTWEVISRSYAAINRHEQPSVAPDWINVDHRREIAMGPADLSAYIRAGTDRNPDVTTYVETVHRLEDHGVVVTYAAHETSQEGFAAEWRGIALLTVNDSLIDRSEIFDEADLDAALARFDELSRPRPRLENTASQVTERFLAPYPARDWAAMAAILADDLLTDVRRGVVGAGIRHGRNAQLEDMRTIADMGMTGFTTDVDAIRGDRLALVRARMSYRENRSDAYFIDVLTVIEVNSEQRIAAIVSFDPDSLDAALDELDHRYIAGEAAPYARVWRAGMEVIDELNQHKSGPLIGRLAYADHRRIPFASGMEFGRGVEELWSLVPDARYRITAVHALTAHGSVATLVIQGTDRHGCELQWARIILFIADEPRVEVYEEDRRDDALARFDELQPLPPKLENAASQVWERIYAYFTARDWDALAALSAVNLVVDDRRRVVNAGLISGRDANVESTRAVADVGFSLNTLSVIATRGVRLALLRVKASGDEPEAIANDALNIVEIDLDGHIAAAVVFDLDDIDAAFEELEARYLTGEEAAHSRTWSVITREIAAFNGHEPAAMTANPLYIDHRPLVSVEGVDLAATERVVWDITPDGRTRIETVHRLSERGAVVTQVVNGSSLDGFYAEWRIISIFTVEADLESGYEVFDEADLDAALERFDELET
jgi:class 3 adenylate cyclase